MDFRLLRPPEVRNGQAKLEVATTRLNYVVSWSVAGTGRIGRVPIKRLFRQTEPDAPDTTTLTIVAFL